MKLRTAVCCLVLACLFLVVSCGEEEKRPSLDDVGTSAAPPGKDYIYAAVGNACHIIDGDTDEVIKTIPHDEFILGAAFSPDKKRYYMTSGRKILAVDTVTMELVDTYNLSSELSKVMISGFCVTDDGKTMYISCGVVKKKQNIPRLNLLPPQLVVYNLETKKVIRNFEIPYMVNQVMNIREDPDHVILTGYDIYKINVKTGKLEVILNMLTPKGDEYPKNYLVGFHGISPGDHGISVFYYLTGEGLNLSLGYVFIDRNKGRAWTQPGNDLWFAYSNILSPDKKHIYSVMDELIKIDAKTGKTVSFVETETGTNYSIVLSSDGKKVYVGPAGPDISVYDAETLKLLKVIPLDADGAVMHRLTL
jgi:DNA-binding beta-propeller fold protein YncE